MSAPPRTPARIPRIVQLVLLLALIASAAAIAFESRRLSQPKAEPAPATRAAEPDAVRLTARQWASLTFATISARAFRTFISTDGKIAVDQDRMTPVFSQYSGRITRIAARLGDIVQRGQPLFYVEATEFVAAQSDLAAALSSIKSAKAQRINAQVNERRQRLLYQARAGARKDLQQSRADLAAADANYRATTIALAAVRARLRILGKSNGAIDAFERSGTMNLEAAVIAPLTGSVTDRQAGVGQYILAGASTPQFTITDLSSVNVVAAVRESDAPAIRIGEQVLVHPLAFPDRVFAARISYVAPALDPATRRIAVRARIENPGAALKPEMFANFDIVTGSADANLAVPEAAVVYEGPSAHVWIAHGERQVEIRAVRLGRSGERMIEVLAGLRAGERVVTTGALFIDRAASSD